MVHKQLSKFDSFQYKYPSFMHHGGNLKKKNSLNLYKWCLCVVNNGKLVAINGYSINGY